MSVRTEQNADRRREIAPDLPRHMGQLLAMIRNQRGISQSVIAAALGRSESANVHRYEKTGASLHENAVRAYIDLLAKPVIEGRAYRDPLSSEQIAILRRMPLTLEAIRVVSEHLFHYDFSHICSSHAPESLRNLVRGLRECRYPAFISDGLFFLHAFNGACLNLFSLNPATGYLRRWEAWHSVAAKAMANSQVRLAHLNPDQFFPPTVDFFFRSTAEYAFTPQMLIFLERLFQLGDAESLRIAQWWRSAQTFKLHYDLNYLMRTIEHRGRKLHVVTPPPQIAHVETAEGERLPYYLVHWESVGEDQADPLENLPGHVAPDALFFAADYDHAGDFHVNHWPVQ